jgi:uroporphyrinogen III methyltransferase/synthase
MTVHLVGAGPGDPGLLTLRGAELLRSCDAVVHDYLVSAPILALVPPTAQRHYVGKRGGADSCKQEDINALLVRLGKVHGNVVRLKGGDPFLFGRGGEEAVALAEAGVPFTVVPGITSGIGAPAYAGIPVTHRAASSAVAFVTGHQQHAPGEPEPLFDWSSVVHVETLVLYMGMHRLEQNCAALMTHGRAPATPVACIQWGTRANQRTVTGTLATIAAVAKAAGIGAPAIVVIGDVVNYREHIRWFDNRPLSGKRIAVTRAREQASALSAALAERGATVVEIPLGRVAPPVDAGPLVAALADPARFPWLAFTSANAVQAVAEHLSATGRDARALAGCRIAAVGRATARALQEHLRLRADLVPTVEDAPHLAAALVASGAPGPILLPQAENARPELAAGLRAAGWAVTTAVAYRIEALPAPTDLDPATLDAVTLASAASAERFVAALGDRRKDLHARIYAIGPRTAEACAALGLTVAAVASTPDPVALAETVARDLR